MRIQDSGLAAPTLPNQNPDQPWVVTLAPNQDYVLELRHRSQSDYGGLSIGGGRNVVIIGGEIEVQDMPDAESGRREALVFHDQTGTVHVEGVWIHGKPLRCLVFDSAQAVFEIENVRCDGTYMWQEDFSTAHADSLMTWKTPRELRFDRYTTDYDNTGLALYEPGSRVILKRTNIRNSPTFPGGVPYIWRESKTTRLTIDRLYAQTGWGRASLGPWPQLSSHHVTLWEAFGTPDGSPRPKVVKVGNGVSRGSYVKFIRPSRDNIWGPSGAFARIFYGIPPGGDFCALGVAGTTYVSPGYE